MKKVLLAYILIFISFLTFADSKKTEDEHQAQDTKNIGHIILFYIPNRLLDLTDIMSFEAAAGDGALFEFTVTKWCQLAGQFGKMRFVEKGFNRQNGGGINEGNLSSFFCIEDGNRKIFNTWGSVKPYKIVNKENDEGISIPIPSESPYSNGLEDFWRFGVHVGWFGGFGVDVHPIAIANFVTGFFFIRLTDTKDI